MSNYLPQTEIPDIRDYLFIDPQRVGSLLSQFSDGRPQEKSESKNRSDRLKTGFRSAFQLERENGRSISQSLALDDLHVSLLEETATALGMLKDVSKSVQERKSWLRGRVRKKIEPGMLLRVTGSTQITDPSTIIGAFKNFAEVVPDDQTTDATSALEGIESLYGSAVTVSIRTGEIDDYQIGFVGEIPHDHDFIPMRRELLLSQIGPNPVQLTTLMQVAAVPTEPRGNNSLQATMAELESFASRMVGRGSDGIDRRALDEIISRLGEFLATTGIAASPRWPAISVLPLAIYRNVLPNNHLEDD